MTDRSNLRGPDVPRSSGGPFELGGCHDGRDHRLRRRDELVREVAECLACGAQFARRTRQERDGYLVAAQGAWIVLSPPRRASPQEAEIRAAAIKRAARELGIVDAPARRTSSTDSTEAAAPPVSFGAARRPSMSEELLAHKLRIQEERVEGDRRRRGARRDPR